MERPEGALAAAELTIPLNGRIAPERMEKTLLTAAIRLSPSDEATDLGPISILSRAADARTISKTVRWGDLGLVSSIGAGLAMIELKQVPDRLDAGLRSDISGSEGRRWLGCQATPGGRVCRSLILSLACTSCALAT